VSRDRAPTLRELLQAKRREALQAVDALDRAIAAVERGLDSNLAPRGCDRRVDGIDCSPSMFRHMCVVCGELFQFCARHGGSNRAVVELGKHMWRAHEQGDTER
jgi:hypothetical protein